MMFSCNPTDAERLSVYRDFLPVLLGPEPNVQAIGEAIESSLGRGEMNRFLAWAEVQVQERARQRAIQAGPVAPVAPTRIELPPDTDPVRDAARIRVLVKKTVPGATVRSVTWGGHRWVAVLGPTTSRPGATTWQLGEAIKPTDGERLAEQARSQGLTLISFEPHARTAVVAYVDPWVEVLRGRIAGLLGSTVRPWDVEISVEWKVTDGQAEPAVLHVLRMPPVPDPEKRRQQWISICDQLLPAPTNTNWWIEDDSQSGRLTVRRAEDPLGKIQVYPWEIEPTYKSIPFAVDVAGEVISLGLIESNALVGGTPGSGKSGGATALLCGVGRLKHVALVGLDPKRVELSLWRPRFSRIATREDDALVVLNALVDEMERRYEWLENQGLKKITPAELSDDLPLIVLLIDELADLVSVGVTKEEKADEAERATRIRRLIAKGRAAGIVVITATQKPQSDVVPTALRDLIQQRVGYATTTDAMTDTILGAGMSRTGGLCHEIPASLRGVCFIVDEGSRHPKRARTFWVPDAEVAGIAERLAHLRVELPWMPEAGAVGTIKRPKAVELDDLSDEVVDVDGSDIDMSGIDLDDIWGDGS